MTPERTASFDHALSGGSAETHLRERAAAPLELLPADRVAMAWAVTEIDSLRAELLARVDTDFKADVATANAILRAHNSGPEVAR